MANLTITVEAAPFITGQWFGETGQTNAIARTNPSAVVSVIGPRGAQGPSGAQVTVTAQEALGGHRAITADGFHATPSLLDKLAGISTGAASIGETAVLQRSGLMVEPTWTWTPDAPVFVGAAGVLTQTPPSGVARRVAWAISATEINVDLFPIIQLA